MCTSKLFDYCTKSTFFNVSDFSQCLAPFIEYCGIFPPLLVTFFSKVQFVLHLETQESRREEWNYSGNFVNATNDQGLEYKRILLVGGDHQRTRARHSILHCSESNSRRCQSWAMTIGSSCLEPEVRTEFLNPYLYMFANSQFFFVKRV